MTKEQIETYEYCKNHLEYIKECKGKLPFETQKYGCGTGAPNITYTLEEIHEDMYKKVFEAIENAKYQIQKIIDEL